MCHFLNIAILCFLYFIYKKKFSIIDFKIADAILRSTHFL